ncbi:hypothetical protein AFLA70_196g001931 [Aspergillus terreus]|uniref:Uncharacterized protein n=1 Tax=Aspergillus terreus TaxID=33178 RepID=A0A5M3YP71_ASPTE|nr:hypothetical protein ATETN484_0002045500 [Aspergillus terreus]GFF15311.1 hypothetical protein AFLA70_196g001931 [Aspergillus terreus]
MSDSDKGYYYTDSGTNSQARPLAFGNHWCTRDYGTASDSNGAGRGDAYHYSNQNGSYYYSNSNGSTYYNNGKGEAWYTPSGGDSRKIDYEEST